MDVKLNNICRACLSKQESMLSLFDIYEHGLTLAMILQSCIDIKVCEDDGLPCCLCDNCILVITQFYNFTVVFEESNKYLQNYLQEIKRNNNANEEITEVIPEEMVIVEHSGINDDNFMNDIVGVSVNEESAITSSEYLCDDTKVDTLIDEQVVTDQYNFKNEIVKHDDYDSKEQLFDKTELSIKSEKSSFEEVIKYECTMCGEAHLYASGFQQHMRLKHQMEDVNCEAFSSRIQIKVHPQPNKSKDSKFNNDEDKILSTCTYCKKQFNSASQLQYHLKLHDGIKNYICEVCGSSFIRKTYLADHMEGHSTEKKHKCKFCGKAFKRRTVLRAHKRVHTHPNHYVCEECGRAFTNSSTLKTHKLLIHIKERNFQCVICNLKFPLKSTLNKHLLRHQKRENGEKGFNCTQCSMEYKDKSSLKRHFENKHQGRIQLISCTDCPKRYTSKANLMKHRRRHHNTIKTEDTTYITVPQYDTL